MSIVLQLLEAGEPSMRLIREARLQAKVQRLLDRADWLERWVFWAEDVPDVPPTLLALARNEAQKKRVRAAALTARTGRTR
jgi:hypothetical protein